MINNGVLWLFGRFVYVKGLRATHHSLLTHGNLKIDVFKVLGTSTSKKIIADLDASRRDLVRSIFKNLVATLQAEILAIKQLWGSPKYVSKNRYSRQLGTLLYKLQVLVLVPTAYST